MKLFPVGHATHPQWQMAAHLALAQLRAVAGPDAASGEAARQTWETQQRFLEARAGTGGLLDD